MQNEEALVRNSDQGGGKADEGEEGAGRSVIHGSSSSVCENGGGVDGGVASGGTGSAQGGGGDWDSRVGARRGSWGAGGGWPGDILLLESQRETAGRSVFWVVHDLVGAGGILVWVIGVLAGVEIAGGAVHQQVVVAVEGDSRVGTLNTGCHEAARHPEELLNTRVKRELLVGCAVA